MPARFSLRQLEYFVAVADGGSISAGAASCHASQGGVSLAITELEHRLGIQLFVRRPAKALSLTEAGLRLVGDARRLLKAADDLHSSAQTSQDEVAGTLPVGCYSTLAPFVIPPVLDDFAGHHPGLDVRVTEGPADDIITSLADGRCEIAFLYANDIRVELASAVIRTTKPYVILAADHPLAAQPKVRLADLADQPLIMFDVPSARNAAQMLTSAGLTAQIRHYSSNIEVVRGLVARGIGYSILVQKWPIDVSYEGRPLVSRPIADPTAERQIVLAWPAGTRQTSRAMALVTFCSEIFAKEQQHG
jgi:DNA-binding transcriptional LysR family regulator